MSQLSQAKHARPGDLYENDFHAWALDQARRLRAGEPLDGEHIAEELESLSGNREDELINRLGLLMAHMLKCEFQPDKQTRSWTATIIEQRRRIARLLNKNPSLKGKLAESVETAYLSAMTLAGAETGIIEQDLPQECPYSLAEILPDDTPPPRKGRSRKRHSPSR
jgi:hypothetical protein